MNWGDAFHGGSTELNKASPPQNPRKVAVNDLEADFLVEKSIYYFDFAIYKHFQVCYSKYRRMK